MRQTLDFLITVSAIVGAPVAIGGSMILLDRTLATVQCEIMAERCNRSFLQGVDYIAEQVDADHDVVVTPKHRR